MTDRKLSPVLRDNYRGGVGWEVERGFRREGTCVYLWLIGVDVWQKPSQHCEALILQLKKIPKNE